MYTAPTFNAVTFDFSGAYTPPAAAAVTFDFGAVGGATARRRQLILG